MNNPFVSVVIPVYNAEQFLPNSIESVLGQSFVDFELLLIDDGSTDNSGAICDAYAEKDNRIRVFHVDNGGASSARNRGLSEAKGEFVVFVDADDWVKESYLEHLMISDADLVVSGVQQFGAVEKVAIPRDVGRKRVSELLLMWDGSVMEYLYHYPVSKRFRMAIIRDNNLLFNNRLFFSEDFCFVLSYLSCIDCYEGVYYADYQYYRTAEERHEKFKMSAEQLIVHRDYHMECFDGLGKNNPKMEMKAVKEDIDIRLVRKFVCWLSSCKGFKEYRENAILFRKQKWSKDVMKLLTGKKERRILYGAVYFPLLSFVVENRIRKLVGR